MQQVRAESIDGRAPATAPATMDRGGDRARHLRAIFMLSAGVTLFGVMDGLGKLLTEDHTVLQIVWARYAFALPVILALARPRDWPLLVRCERPLMQAGRALLPLLASICVILGLGLMPLADATVITFAAPLLVVALAAPILGERVRIHSWLGVACGFLGVLVIVRPGYGALAWAAIFPLGTALFFALYQVLTRLVSRGDPPLVTLAWTILTGLLVTTPLLPIGWLAVAPLDWLLLAGSGLLFGTAHFLLIRAFALAPAPLLAPFTYVQIVAALVFGLLVFDHMPDGWTMLGTLLIMLAGFYVIRRSIA